MKRINSLIYLLFYLVPTLGLAQDRFEEGFILTTEGEKFTGTIKKSFNKAGSIVFSGHENRRKTYSPSSLRSFSIGGTNYISYCYDFYEVIFDGVKTKLYRKVTDNRDKLMYNGAQVVGFVKTTDGQSGQYYVQHGAGLKLDLITEKNFTDYFSKLLEYNYALSARIKDGSLGYSQIESIVQLLND